MRDYILLGNLNPEPIEKEFGKLKTTEVIVTYERLEHIHMRHSSDEFLFEKYAVLAVENTDLILKDFKNDNTVLMIKCIDDTNMNVAVRLALEEESDEKHSKNSVMTFFRLRQKNLKKLKNRAKPLYKKE